MALQVIGAGFGRTGTTSLKQALEHLGFVRCHHMDAVATSGDQVRHWQALAEGAEPEWDTIFEGFRASCDWPSCNYWHELSRQYPEAKIVLTVRDEPRWYDSVAETIYPASSLGPRWIIWMVPQLARFQKMVFAQVWDGVFGGRFEDRAHALQIYRDHIADVKSNAPADRLLVFEVKDGWEPLCHFLGVPVPEIDFPHANDAASIKRMLLGARVVGWTLLAGAVLGLLAWLI